MSNIKIKMKNRRNGRELLIGGNYLPVVFPYGLSPHASTVDYELKKIEIAESLGADMIKDNSIGRREWQELLERAVQKTNLCVGASATITAANMAFQREGCYMPKEDDFYSAFQKLSNMCDAIEGFPTITEESLIKLEESKRILKNSASRAGSIITRYMKQDHAENPFYSNFDWFLENAKKEDLTLILGNGFRAFSLVDSLDELQMDETKLVKEFSERAINRTRSIKSFNRAHHSMEKEISFFHGLMKKILGYSISAEAFNILAHFLWRR